MEGASKSSKSQADAFPDVEGGRVTEFDADDGKALTLGAGLGRNIGFAAKGAALTSEVVAPILLPFVFVPA